MCVDLTYKFIIREDVLVVRLSGELDHHGASSLRDLWQKKMYESGIKHVILNLEGITFMDSSGIGVVLGRYKEVLQLGGELIICSINPAIERLFEMSGLFKIIQSVENEQFALDSLGVAS